MQNKNQGLVRLYYIYQEITFCAFMNNINFCGSTKPYSKLWFFFPYVLSITGTNSVPDNSNTLMCFIKTYSLYIS